MADRPPAHPTAAADQAPADRAPAGRAAVDRGPAAAALPDPVATGLSWRPLTAADTGAWHALVAAVEEAEGRTGRRSEADLRDLLVEGPAKDPARLSLVGVDADGVFRAHGIVDVDAAPVGEVRVQLLGDVHPAWRRRGTGAQLLSWQLAAARAHLGRARHGLPARLGVDVEEGSPDRTALVTAAGLAPLRWFRTLHRPLDADAGRIDAPAVPAGVRIVPWTEDLHEAVRLAHNEVFRDHWGSQPRTAAAWRRQVSGHRETRHDWSYVALDESGDPPAGAAGPDGVPLGGGPLNGRRVGGGAVDGAPGVGRPGVDGAGAGRDPVGGDPRTGARDPGARGSGPRGEGPVVAGYVLSGAHPGDWPALGAPEGHTHYVGVRRPWRRRGLAPALLLTALRAYAAAGMAGGALEVDAENPSGAAGLYERMGYRPRRGSVLHALHLPPG